MRRGCAVWNIWSLWLVWSAGALTAYGATTTHNPLFTRQRLILLAPPRHPYHYHPHSHPHHFQYLHHLRNKRDKRNDNLRSLPGLTIGLARWEARCASTRSSPASFSPSCLLSSMRRSLSHTWYDIGMYYDHIFYHIIHSSVYYSALHICCLLFCCV